MKNILLIVAMAFCLMGATTEDEKTVFTTKNIVWYGLDFTNAKFVGGFNQAGGIGAVSGEDLVEKWIPAWNNLILYESKKFDIIKAFHKDNVYYDINSVTALNAKIDGDKCIVPNPAEPISKEEITKMVAKYTGDKKEGLGLVFVVDNFNKNAINADMHVVFFDIATKKVLLCEPVSGKPVGIGVRNYWAGAINAVLKQIGAGKFKNWEQKNK